MIKLNKIYNEDCLAFLSSIQDKVFDIVLTSPPYNTSRDCDDITTMKNNWRPSGRYLKIDGWRDNKTKEEYISWCIDIFNKLDSVLKENGVIIWNVSYGGDVSSNSENLDTMWLCIADIIRNTGFTVADRIVWKKSNSFPNNMSPNKLNRIVEDIFVFVRKLEIRTFHSNKIIVGERPTGQKMYSPICNYIEAPNNSENCSINKATFSEELCIKLFNIYAPKNAVVYDPFMGTGTTAIACLRKGLNYVGTEISKEQIEWSENRIQNFQRDLRWWI